MGKFLKCDYPELGPVTRVTVSHSRFLINQRPRRGLSLMLTLVPSWKTHKGVLFVIICCSPSWFLSDFSDFFSDLVLSSDKAIIVDTRNISLKIAFSLLLVITNY